jgi:hypothetical protein
MDRVQEVFCSKQCARNFWTKTLSQEQRQMICASASNVEQEAFGRFGTMLWQSAHASLIEKKFSDEKSEKRIAFDIGFGTQKDKTSTPASSRALIARPIQNKNKKITGAFFFAHESVDPTQQGEAFNMLTKTDPTFESSFDKHLLPSSKELGASIQKFFAEQNRKIIEKKGPPMMATLIYFGFHSGASGGDSEKKMFLASVGSLGAAVFETDTDETKLIAKTANQTLLNSEERARMKCPAETCGGFESKILDYFTKGATRVLGSVTAVTPDATIQFIAETAMKERIQQKLSSNFSPEDTEKEAAKAIRENKAKDPFKYLNGAKKFLGKISHETMIVERKWDGFNSAILIFASADLWNILEITEILPVQTKKQTQTPPVKSIFMQTFSPYFKKKFPTSKLQNLNPGEAGFLPWIIHENMGLSRKPSSGTVFNVASEIARDIIFSIEVWFTTTTKTKERFIPEKYQLNVIQWSNIEQ